MQGNKEANYGAWIQKAEEDELSIHAILKEEAGAPSTACFLSQQLAEKLLKGLLVFHGKEFLKVHDLLELETLLLDIIPDINEIHSDIRLLNRYYIETRYPGDYPEFTFAECNKAFEAALHVKDFVLSKIKPTEPNAGFGRIAVILACTVIAMVGVSALYLVTSYPRHMPVSPTPSPSSLPSQSPTPTTTQSPSVDTTSWKTYRNEKYGFEMKYPGEWEPLEGSAWLPEGIIESPPLFNVGFAPIARGTFYSDAYYIDVSLFVLRDRLSLDGLSGDVSIAGLAGTEADIIWGTLRKGVKNKYIFVEKDKQTYLFFLQTPLPEEQFAEKNKFRLKNFYAMIETFDFLDK